MLMIIAPQLVLDLDSGSQHREEVKPLKLIFEEELCKILVSLSLILGGTIIGIKCASAVPASLAVEVSLFIAIGIMIVTMLSALKKRVKKGARSSSAGAVLSRYPRKCSDSLSTEGDSLCASDREARNLESALPSQMPSVQSLPVLNVTIGETSTMDSIGPLRGVEFSRNKRSPPTSPRNVATRSKGREQVSMQKINSRRSPTPRADPSLPIHERVEQEKLRLSLTMFEEAPIVKSTATALRFQDTKGRTIRYTLRPSKKKSSSTFLELMIEGEKPRKVRSIIYDDASGAINDGKTEPLCVPPCDIATVMKSLILLCKIASVKLDCINGSPELKRLLYNFDCNGPIRKVISCGSLAGLDHSERSFTARSPYMMRTMQSS